MIKWNVIITIILMLPMLTASCVSPTQNNISVDDTLPQKSDYTPIASAWVDSVLTTMSLEERVGQLFMPSSFGSTDAVTLQSLRRYIADDHVGGILFLKGDIHSQAVLSDTLQRISRVALFIGIDAEWGLNMRLEDAPKFPTNATLGVTNDDQLMFDYGREVAREARLVGINMIMGPVLDVLTNPKNKVIGKRAFGSDASMVATMAVAYARGLEDGSVLSIGKHFPGHGATMEDSHHELPEVDREKAYLDTVDFLPFKEYVKSNLSGVMVGHLYVPALDGKRRSAALSPIVMTDFLKEDLGFEGLILTDAMNMGGAEGEEHLSIRALQAGADIIVSPKNTSQEIKMVLDAVRSGEIHIDLINEKCRKILFYKYKVGLSNVERIRIRDVQSAVNNENAADLSRRLDSAVSSEK